MALTPPSARSPSSTGEGLRRALCEALARAGGRVEVSASAGNLVRARAEGEERPDLPFVIEAQGLPNLLHEFVHFALRGRLELDHGYDYARIPFDLEHPVERRWLWEELACCTVSCAYLPAGSDVRNAWFAEQVGIQHHFFGFDSPEAFVARVTPLLTAHGDEWRCEEERAYRECARLLGAVAETSLARPGRPLSLAQLWKRLPPSPASIHET